jgi:2-polyprenyl-3-methyl-5-hydroxy-6-metoxy-1,4-benzoquinol methylase
MDYREQQGYLNGSRVWGTAGALLLFLAGGFCAWGSNASSPAILGLFAAMLLSLAVFVYYTPDYLHLSVIPEKPARWSIKIRWRLIAALLVIGLPMAGSTEGRLLVLLASAILLVVNFIARKLPSRRVALFLWVCEFLLLSGFLLAGPLNLLVGAALFAAITYLAVVAAPQGSLTFPSIAIIAGALAAWLTVIEREAAPVFATFAGLLVLVSGLITYFLVRRAQRQTESNIEQAMSELVAFTGHPAERIWELWRTSGRQLAENWKTAAIPEHDSARLAKWYRDNSELYLFDLSGYNLEYKRIRSNLGVLKLARGACLDYGAGNGEILLELAKRGHPVTYYDVEGLTMRFARHRAEQRGLKLEFLHSKDDLANHAQKHGFDTVFSLDVLEHLPDLRGELEFLSSTLNPGGLLVFDVPAGATKSHPMHLNHQLDVVSYLRSLGLKDTRSLRQRMPFRKEEKYFFRAMEGRPVSVPQTTQKV